MLWSDLALGASTQLATLVDEFNKAHSDIHVTIDDSKAVDDGSYLARMRAGESPDVALLGGEALVDLRDAGKITAVQGCIDKDPTYDVGDIVPASRLAYALGGQQIGMPVTVSTPVLMYERNTWKAAGLDPDKPPKTIDQVEAAITQLQKIAKVSGGLIIADYSWIVSQWAAQLNIDLAPDANGHAIDGARRVDLSDPRIAAALDSIGVMARGNNFITQISNPSGYDDLLQLTAASHTAAMAFHTSGSLGTVYSILDSGGYPGSDVGVAPLPGPGTGCTIGGGALWLTTRDQTKAAASWKLIRYLTDAHAQSLFATLGYAPVRTTTLAEPELQFAWAKHPGLKVPYDQVSTPTPTASQIGVAIAVDPDFDSSLSTAVLQVIDQQSSASDALEVAQRTINALLDAYYQLHQAAP